MNTQKKEAMNLLVTLDSNYVLPLTVMLSSIMRSNPGESFKVYVANSSLTDEDFARIRASVELNRCRIIGIGIDGSLLKDAPVLDRISTETYYRLIAMDYLPAEVDRVLYIDPDTIVINSLREIYDTEMGDNVLLGSSHVTPMFNRINLRRLKMSKGTSYLNAGVLLMNIAAMRRAVTCAEIFAYINENAKKLYLADQDVINALFCDKTLYISPCIFNLDEKTLFQHRKELTLEDIRRDSVIVHYNGKYKPWKEGYKGKLKGLWDEENEYLNSTAATATLVRARAV